MAFSFSDANTQQTIDYMVNHPIDFPESEWGHISAEGKCANELFVDSWITQSLQY
jgi:hypothetical protein